MATKEMPLLLDNGLPMQLDGVGDVDDLFGDSANLPLRQPTKQIELRLDQLRSRGCCKTVAWSKVGTIASITPDGQELELRFLRCQPKDGEWGLSDPTTCSLVRGTPEDPLVHLEWAETNNPELAVFDSAGRVALLIFSTTVNHSFIVRRWDSDPVDDNQAVVGCHWLAANLSTGGIGEKATRQSYNVLYGPAIRNERGGYHYGSSFVHAEAPSHPQAGRSALLTVTASGMLKMLWMQVNNRPEETRLELESISSADELITHAAFASEKKHLFLALVTAARQIEFVRIDIQWIVQAGKERGSQDTRFNAGLVEKHCATTTWVGDSPEDASTPEVTHLLVLPSMLDKTGKDTVPPMVVSVRARTSDAGSLPAAQCIIDRWEAVEQRPNLQSAIEQLGNRRNSVSSEPSSSFHMRPLEPIIIDKCAVGVQSAHFGRVVILTFSDGSVQYRDRFSFEEIYKENEYSSVMSLRQVGFTFPDDCQCQQIALSPTFSSMVQLGDNGKMKWSKLRLPDGDIGNSMRDEQYAATIASLAVTTATSIKYQTNFDDILATVRSLSTKPRFMQDWVNELVRILAIQIDYVVEPSHDALLKNTQLPSCLAIMISLGFRGDTQARSFQSTFGLITAAIRSAAFNVTVATTAQFNVAGRKSPMDDYEVVEMLASIVKWSLDLVAWITDSLFELMSDDNFVQRLTPERINELAPYLEKNNDVALHLLLCSSSRCFLSALCRRLVHTEAMAGKAVAFYRRQSAAMDPSMMANTSNPRMRSAFQKLQQVSSSAIVRVAEFDKLVNTLGSAINQAYASFLPKMVKSKPNPPQGKEEDEAVKSARGLLETQMLVATGPPLGFLPIIRKFFGIDLPAFRKATDPARLFFGTFSVVNVQDDDGVVDGVRTTHLDAFSKSKVKMGPGKRWKRCTRCTSVMEDVGGRGPGLTFLMTQQRRCPCNGTLAVLPPGKLDFLG